MALNARPQGYADCIVAFFRDVCAGVNGGEPGPFATFDDAIRTAEITASVQASAREGSWVVPPP
ncbi:MAG: hypothetical protein ICV70_01320 [Jiangellaceae bacterium]|nr:hypothetical protein [Jiangellaceae bacterium]